jgi:hypothetical protein
MWVLNDLLEVLQCRGAAIICGVAVIGGYGGDEVRPSQEGRTGARHVALKDERVNCLQLFKYMHRKRGKEVEHLCVAS